MMMIMMELDHTAVEDRAQASDAGDRYEETIANMDATDWMTMLMEMRVIGAN